MIALDDVHKSFGEVHALRGVSFRADDGKITGILGSGNAFLQSISPCTPADSPCGTQVGALPVNCGSTPVRGMTWSEIKYRYRGE